MGTREGWCTMYDWNSVMNNIFFASRSFPLHILISMQNRKQWKKGRGESQMRKTWKNLTKHNPYYFSVPQRILTVVWKKPLLNIKNESRKLYEWDATYLKYY